MAHDSVLKCITLFYAILQLIAAMKVHCRHFRKKTVIRVVHRLHKSAYEGDWAIKVFVSLASHRSSKSINASWKPQLNYKVQHKFIIVSRRGSSVERT